MKHETIKGDVHPGFDPVLSTFAENFDRRGRTRRRMCGLPPGREGRGHLGWCSQQSDR